MCKFALETFLKEIEMKLKVISLAALVLLMSSCYGPGSQAVGTVVGANVGGHVGGMIGGRSGGFWGDVFGTVIGTVAGAAIGNAVTAPPRQYEEDYTEYRGYDATTAQRKPSHHHENHQSEVRESSELLEQLQVRNLRFIDGDKNRIINSDETCQLLFEVSNNGTRPVRVITPLVYEVNKMKHIYISKPAVIEELKPGQYVTYTITIRSDNRLSNGTATFCIELSDANGITVPCREFDIDTAR